MYFWMKSSKDWADSTKACHNLGLISLQVTKGKGGELLNALPSLVNLIDCKNYGESWTDNIS